MSFCVSNIIPKCRAINKKWFCLFIKLHYKEFITLFQLKLGELQTLMMQLLGEKNMLHNYHEESSLRSPDISIQPHLSQEPMVNGGTGNSTAC